MPRASAIVAAPVPARQQWIAVPARVRKRTLDDLERDAQLVEKMVRLYSSKRSCLADAQALRALAAIGRELDAEARAGARAKRGG